MSDLVTKQQAAVALAGDTSSPARDPHAHLAGHPLHLAHHFESPEQQYNSAKVGMWVFLATELLMFGGLFCAYSVYRHNHPEVFEFAHRYLDRTLGAVNTIILITSSLTMAWGVREAQLGRRGGLVICLILTLLGGCGFMAIKSIEYHHKYVEHVWLGAGNQFSKLYHGPAIEEGPSAGQGSQTQPTTREAAPATSQPVERVGDPWIDPNAGTPDEARLKPTQIIPAGLAPPLQKHREREVELSQLPPPEKDRI